MPNGVGLSCAAGYQQSNKIPTGIDKVKGKYKRRQQMIGKCMNQFQNVQFNSDTLRMKNYVNIISASNKVGLAK